MESSTLETRLRTPDSQRHTPPSIHAYVQSEFVLRFDRKDRRSSSDSRTAGRLNEFLSELFASKVRAAVLGQTIPRPHLAWSLTEFSRTSRSSHQLVAARVLQARAAWRAGFPARRRLPTLPGEPRRPFDSRADRAGRQRARSRRGAARHAGRNSGTRNRPLSRPPCR